MSEALTVTPASLLPAIFESVNEASASNLCCRHARDGSVTSMFTTSAYQYNPRHSAAPSEMPRGIKPEPNEGNTSALTAAPQTDDLVKLGKRQAWAKFLAYEASSAVFACCARHDVLSGIKPSE